MLLSSPPLDPAALQEAVIMPADEVRFNLIESIQRYSDYDEQTCPAEERGEIILYICYLHQYVREDRDER